MQTCASKTKDIPVIKVQVDAEYLEHQSNPNQHHYVHAYHVSITNEGTSAAQLLSRHWIITDANNRIQEVKGRGVVGEQPSIKPGETFRYTSSAILETPVGTMHGSYQMVSENGTPFNTQIPEFCLALPLFLH